MTPEQINYARWLYRHAVDEASFTEPANIVYQTGVTDNQNAGTIDRFVRLLLVVGHVLWLSTDDSSKRFSLLEFS